MIIRKKKYKRDMLIVGSIAGTSAALAATATTMGAVALKNSSYAKKTCMNLESELDIKASSHDRQLKEISQAVYDMQRTMVDHGWLR